MGSGCCSAPLVMATAWSRVRGRVRVRVRNRVRVRTRARFRVRVRVSVVATAWRSCVSSTNARRWPSWCASVAQVSSLRCRSRVMRSRTRGSMQPASTSACLG